MNKILTKIYRWLFNRCPACGGKLVVVKGWYRDDCVKCKRHYKYFF